MKTNKWKTWFWGTFFLLAAGFIIVVQLEPVSISVWKLLLTVFLVAIFLQSVMRLEYFGIFMPIAVVGVLFSKPLGITAITPWPIVIAGLLVTIGCYTLFKRKPKWAKQHQDTRREDWHLHRFAHSEHTTKDGKTYTEDSFKQAQDNVEGNEIQCKVAFGESSKYLYAGRLEKATFSCRFGSLKVFFDQVQLAPEGAIVDVSCSFGAIELYIPRQWRVKDSISASLGGVSYNGACAKEPEAELRIVGDVSLGGIEITYI